MYFEGKLIVIEGPDGAGKATQTQLLVDALKANGQDLHVKQLSFPNYEQPSGQMVRQFLSKGLRNSSYNRLAQASQHSILYAADRVMTMFTPMKDSEYSPFEWITHRAGNIVTDRYVTSSMLHQGGALRSNSDEQEFLDRLDYLEYLVGGLPEPDLVIYLDVPVEVSLRNLEKRYEGKERPSDILENADHLKSVGMIKDTLISMYGWKPIDCTAMGMMRDPQKIHEEIMEVVRHNLAETN